MQAILPKRQTNNLYNNKYIVINEDTQLIEAWEVFENTKERKLAVLSKDGNFVGYIAKESLYNLISFYGLVDDVEGLIHCLQYRTVGDLVKL